MDTVTPARQPMIRIQLGYDRFVLLPATADNIALTTQLVNTPVYASQYDACYEQVHYCPVEDATASVTIEKILIDPRPIDVFRQVVKAERDAVEAAKQAAAAACAEAVLEPAE